MAKLTLNGAINIGSESLPDQLPLPKFSVNIKVHRMSTGATGSGFEVVEKLGTYYTDFSVRAVFLTKAQLDAIELLAVNQTVFVLALKADSGSTLASYNVIFGQDGYEPFMLDLSEYDFDEDPAPPVRGADLKFKIINKVS